MGHRWIISDIAQHLIDNPNRTVSIGELQRISGDRTSLQIIASLNKWRQRPEVGAKLDVVIPGRAWRWNDSITDPVTTNGHAPRTGAGAYGLPEVTLPPEPPTPAPTRPPEPAERLTFEHIGQSAHGAHVLRASNGKLYTATEL